MHDDRERLNAVLAEGARNQSRRTQMMQKNEGDTMPRCFMSVPGFPNTEIFNQESPAAHKAQHKTRPSCSSVRMDTQFLHVLPHSMLQNTASARAWQDVGDRTGPDTVNLQKPAAPQGWRKRSEKEPQLSAPCFECWRQSIHCHHRRMCGSKHIPVPCSSSFLHLLMLIGRSSS